ncbi:MAG: hypothetical protein WAZ77_20055 [Candidatus Nitrosopolaris sp.]
MLIPFFDLKNCLSWNSPLIVAALIPINYSLLNDTNETIQELPKAILKLTDVMKNQGSYMGGGRR